MCAEAPESQYFRDLYELASSDLSTSEKIASAIDIGRDRLDVDYGVLSYTGEGNYEVVQTNIESGKYAPGSVTELGETWCRHVVEKREALAFADAAESRYSDDVAREVTGLQCYVGAPVVVDGEVYGTICFSADDPRQTEITESEQQFVSLLGEWIASEIEQQKHTEELRRQNERLDEFTGIVAHDLRNPLSGAIGYTELALDRTEGEVHGYLERVAGSLERMDALIGECLVLAKEGADVGEREPVDLASVAEDAWETVSTGSATLTLDVAKTINADRARLQRLFENLFRNANEHCQSGVSVTVSDHPEGFTVSDDGPGLPDAVAAALEDPDDVEDIKDLGLGLLIVERVVTGHGWDLAVDTSGAGTTFTVTGVNAAAPAHRQYAEA
ncbi:sensor histidine kinase [Halobellus sp. EA9]|uniref:sensor histidine kinase n=1 Tax=Halobellus sp. EA9 TaxID=3421647 RepID=UPI003EB9DF46